MVNTFLVKMDHDCDGVSCVTYDDYHAEIARLQAEVEHITEINEKNKSVAAKVVLEKFDILEQIHEQIDTAHNAAIDAAALVQVLRMEEGGSRHMSALSAEAQSAIRALKRPVTEGDKA